MMHFCTLFNSFYIQKGLATYLSLEKVTDKFHLYVMAFDKECYDKLNSYNLQHLTVELVDDFETPDLLAVKPTRNMAEYCWTCSPAVTYHFLTKYNLPEITYLDSDLMFTNNPQILFEEIGSASVGLSEHWFHYNNERAGRFCVQFVYFKNDTNGLAALKYWRDSCIEWCFARYKDGKYGDQSYLEEIPRRFQNVHIIKHRGCGLAPWNYKIYKYLVNYRIYYNGLEYPVIFFHFHGMKFLVDEYVLTMTSGDGSIPTVIKPLYYDPYIELIREVYNKYLYESITTTKIKDISILKKTFNIIKHSLHDNPIARFFYYKVFDVRYNGVDKINKR